MQLTFASEVLWRMGEQHLDNLERLAAVPGAGQVEAGLLAGPGGEGGGGLAGQQPGHRVVPGVHHSWDRGG